MEQTYNGYAVFDVMTHTDFFFRIAGVATIAAIISKQTQKNILGRK